MQFSFSSEGATLEAFLSFSSIGAGAILCMALVVLLWSWDRSKKLYVRTVVLFSLVGFGCVAWVGYATTFGRFVAAEASAAGLRLQYVGPFSHEVILPPDAVDTVLFGAPGKSNYRCHLAIQSKSGQRYRSATLDVPLSTCKSLREDFLRALAGGT